MLTSWEQSGRQKMDTGSIKRRQLLDLRMLIYSDLRMYIPPEVSAFVCLPHRHLHLDIPRPPVPPNSWQVLREVVQAVELGVKI
jgi:hypothetical protein